jgi:hypothetical protein
MVTIIYEFIPVICGRNKKKDGHSGEEAVPVRPLLTTRDEALHVAPLV